VAGARQLADLEHQARHDALTGLPNRVLLHREFERMVAAGGNTSAVPALMLLDLNRFKEINDTLGHHVGDRLLQQVGPRMLEALAGEQAMVCRLGGDEFAVLAAGFTGASDAVALARRVLDALRRPFDAGGMRLEVGASVGVAAWPAHGRDSHELLRCADVAMYEAKRSGAGVVLYDAAFDQHTPQRLALVQDLGEAIRSNQLLLHFQPKVRLADGAVTGFEALVRWQHPRLGLLAPGAFVPLAEVGDLMQSVTQCVVELGLSRCRQWRDAGMPHTLAINLSPRNLLERDFVERFEAALRDSGADPSQVELELTETALMQDPEGAAARLRRIAALGVRVSIDDFGTGYSSLAHLRRLPIHALKIDRMFVKDLLSSAQDEAIVRATIGLAHNLGLEVIAEGVETAAVRDALRAMGCDQIQGYLLSPPLAWNDAAAWLARRPG
jgi:diguanylate cyclase (GGDEF)-like protein